LHSDDKGEEGYEGPFLGNGKCFASEKIGGKELSLGYFWEEQKVKMTAWPKLANR
jgi:hypothetical protein